MKNWQNSIIHKILSVVIISALGLFMVASLMTLHVHHLSDGRIIVHSHPVNHSDSDSENSHSHTDEEYLFLGARTTIFENVTEACYITFVIKYVQLDDLITNETICEIEIWNRTSGSRSPPSISC